MKKKLISCLLLVCFLLFSQVSAEQRSRKEIASQYKKWLEEEVVYIISPLEKDVFLALETDKERDLFIQAFWKHRDPTPGTPENEFRKEHYRRIDYANYTFGRGIPKSGWKTDRGRMYILLGEPSSTERFLGEAQIYNTEVWFYQGLEKYGLAPGFHLIFYQKGGSGEFVLYSPTSDGPQALLASYFGDQTNYLRAFRILRKLNPDLARFSLSLIPGESTRTGHPSLASDILIQNIGLLPQKQFEDMYAKKFLMYKDIVEVEYSANYIGSDSIVMVLKNAAGTYFVHTSVEIKRFSVQSYQNKYVTTLLINGNVSDINGKTIYQYEESVPIELNDIQLRNITYNPFSLCDMFPLVPGDYKLSILIKNEVSKEFTSLEEDISIPQNDSLPWMSSLILGYKMEAKNSSRPSPFRLGEHQIFCRPNKIFRAQDNIFLFFQLVGIDGNLREKGELKYEILNEKETVYSLRKKVLEYADMLGIHEEFSLENFKPGYYEMNVALAVEGKDILSESEYFEITPLFQVPLPWVYSKTFPPMDHPSYAFITGTQYFKQGKIDQALVQLEKAYRDQPDSKDYALGLARVCMTLEDFQRAKNILLPLLEYNEKDYNVYSLMARAFQSLREYDQAISVYNQAISHFGINIHLINSLGECYLSLGQKEEALAAWKKSLEINPDQPEIKAKVESLKK